MAGSTIILLASSFLLYGISNPINNTANVRLKEDALEELTKYTNQLKVDSISVCSSSFLLSKADFCQSLTEGFILGNYELIEIIQQLFVDGNPGGVKHVLSLLNICEDHLRLPLVKVNEKTAKKLYELTAQLGEKVV